MKVVLQTGKDSAHVELRVAGDLASAGKLSGIELTRTSSGLPPALRSSLTLTRAFSFVPFS